METLWLSDGCTKAELLVRQVYLNEGVVEQEHDSGEIPDPSPAIVEHLANIANITNFWMTKTEFPMVLSAATRQARESVDLPNNQGGVEDRHGHDNRNNQARNQT